MKNYWMLLAVFFTVLQSCSVKTPKNSVNGLEMAVKMADSEMKHFPEPWTVDFYQQSCSNIEVRGNMLTATCRTMKGRMQRTSLANVDRCAGDIGNNNGQLNCNMR